MKDEHLPIFDCANVCMDWQTILVSQQPYHHDGCRTAIHIRRDFQDN